MNWPQTRSDSLQLRSKPHAVVFDMDGLIFDTEPLYHEAFIATGVETGHDISLEFCLSTIGFPVAATGAAFAERCGPGFDFDMFWAKASKRFYELAEVELPLKPGVVELLDVLDDARLPRAIATHRATKPSNITLLYTACWTASTQSLPAEIICTESPIPIRFRKPLNDSGSSRPFALLWRIPTMGSAPRLAPA